MLGGVGDEGAGHCQLVMLLFVYCVGGETHGYHAWGWVEFAFSLLFTSLLESKLQFGNENSLFTFHFSLTLHLLLPSQVC